FSKPASMFLDRNFKRLAKVTNYLPPFGFKTQERIIDVILTATKTYGLGPDLDSLSCKRCIIVGNGGILSNKSLGSRIDEYDIVIRLNEAPVSGYTRDVGTKTTLRITYPEGAIQKPERYEKDSLFVFSAFKPLDFKWLRQMVFKEKLQGTEGFWKSVAHFVPRQPSEIRILNPYFIQEAAFQFIGLPQNNGLMGKGNIPTLGTVAITMALHNCDEVAVAGFGYDMNTPHAPLHYYETVKMSAIKESWTHNIAKEKEFLRKLEDSKKRRVLGNPGPDNTEERDFREILRKQLIISILHKSNLGLSQISDRIEEGKEDFRINCVTKQGSSNEVLTTRRERGLATEGGASPSFSPLKKKIRSAAYEKRGAVRIWHVCAQAVHQGTHGGSLVVAEE
ncbi:hypothetical protein QQF64_014713, partial [Cirrhinus molitorella]